MTVLYELRRVIAKATDPNDDDITQLLGCYPTLNEADLAWTLTRIDILHLRCSSVSRSAATNLQTLFRCDRSELKNVQKSKNEPAKLEDYRLPSYWASALINDDWSGLDEDEIKTIQDFLFSSDLHKYFCIDIADDSSFQQCPSYIHSSYGLLVVIIQLTHFNCVKHLLYLFFIHFSHFSL